MKKIILSAAVAAMALSTSAFAADKGIDIVTNGQAVIYYETQDDNGAADKELLGQSSSAANVGVQLDLGADLGNNFTFGSQLSYLGTLGLENEVVSNVKQGNTPDQITGTDTRNELMLSKIFVAKKIGNSTVKLGRQELPKSLSPLAFSEGWNVFKNTFDAALVVNSDIPDTTVVGAYVGNSMGVMNSNGAGFTEYGNTVTTNAYMLTVQNKSIPMTTLTGSYYDVMHAATAAWIDAQVAGKDLPLGLKIGLQAGQIDPETAGDDTTTAMGAKIALAPVKALTLQVAYSSVDDGDAAIKNVGTGIKTPLFTQMIYNQNAIAVDADTVVVKASYNTGDYGKFIAQYGMTSAGDKNINTVAGKGNDYNELDLIYRLKSGGVSYWASVMMIDTDKAGGIIGAGADADKDTKVRLWGRYSF